MSREDLTVTEWIEVELQPDGALSRRRGQSNWHEQRRLQVSTYAATASSPAHITIADLPADFLERGLSMFACVTVLRLSPEEARHIGKLLIEAAALISEASPPASEVCSPAEPSSPSPGSQAFDAAAVFERAAPPPPGTINYGGDLDLNIPASCRLRWDVKAQGQQIALHLTATLPLPAGARAHLPAAPASEAYGPLVAIEAQARELLIRFLRPLLGEKP